MFDVSQKMRVSNPSSRIGICLMDIRKKNSNVISHNLTEQKIENIKKAKKC